MFAFVFVLLLASLAVSAPVGPCAYVDSEFVLLEKDNVKACVDTYTVDNEFIDKIYRNLEAIENIYPYVEINQHPPGYPLGYFNTVNYHDELATMKKAFNNSEGKLFNVVRAAQEFIAKFRDGHFTLTFSRNETENIFVDVTCVLPFSWESTNNNDSTASVYITESMWSSIFLEQENLDIIRKKQQANVAVKTVDGVDGFEFFSNFFGAYNSMKSLQGRLVYTKAVSINPFPILTTPISNDMLFNNHTIVFADNDTAVFGVGFINMKNKKARDLGDEHQHPLASTTFDDEAKVVRFMKNFKRRPIRNRAEHEYIKCGYKNNMNYVVIGTFAISSEQAVIKYMNEMIDCVESFDKNSDPITILLSMNGGGVVALEQFCAFLLMPNSDPRSFGAFRKTDTNKRIAIDKKYAGELANLDNKCSLYGSDPSKVWDTTAVDHFGDVTHTRTGKYFMSYRDVLRENFKYALSKNIRKPTDVIIATDGFCFSACSMFVLNSIRSGAAVVAGYGSTNPGDTNFVAGQCPSSVIEIESLVDEFADNSRYGLQFRSTFFETYNISAKADEIIPGDFEVMRIDKHCGFHKILNFDPEDILPYTSAVHVEFKTKCNPLNKRLFLSDSNCKVDDPNALDAGHPCGSNGEWDKSKCLIFTCKPGYVIDFNTNKCVENICEPRMDPSSSSTVRPLMGIIVAIACFLAYFNH